MISFTFENIILNPFDTLFQIRDLNSKENVNVNSRTYNNLRKQASQIRRFNFNNLDIINKSIDSKFYYSNVTTINKGSSKELKEYNWLWFVPKHIFKKYKKNYFRIPQTYLPQLQISFGGDGISLALIQLENGALKNDKYRNRFLEVLDENFLSIQRDLYLYLEYFPGYEDRKDIDDIFTKKRFGEFKNKIQNDFKIIKRISFSFWKSEIEINETTLEIEILEKFSILERIYKQLFENTKIDFKKNPDAENYNQDENERSNGRKNSGERNPQTNEEVLKYFRNSIVLPGKEITKLHVDYKNRLRKHLKSLKLGEVIPEKDFVDLRFIVKQRTIFFEIKTNQNPIYCIREAVGQLLFYCYKGSQKIGNKPIELIICGPTSLNKSIKPFEEYLQNILKINIKYFSINEIEQIRNF